MKSASGSFPGRVLVLLLAVLATGVGGAMVLNVRIVPNPADGLVQAIAETVHRNVGLTKNCFDIANVCVTLLLSVCFAGALVGVGLGTVVAALGVGRVMAVFNRLCSDAICRLSGMEADVTAK